MRVDDNLDIYLWIFGNKLYHLIKKSILLEFRFISRFRFDIDLFEFKENLYLLSL